MDPPTPFKLEYGPDTKPTRHSLTGVTPGEQSKLATENSPANQTQLTTEYEPDTKPSAKVITVDTPGELPKPANGNSTATSEAKECILEGVTP